MKWTKLSCHDFVDNHVRLHSSALAYNLGNYLRQQVLPRPMKTWTMTTVRKKLIKIEAKVVRHAKYLTFINGEGRGPASAVLRDFGTNTTVRRDTDPTSAKLMIIDPSSSKKPQGACDVSPDDLGHKSSIRASGPLFWLRTRPIVPFLVQRRSLRFGSLS